LTKVDKQPVDTVLSRAGFEFLGEPPQVLEADGQVELSGAIEHVNVVVL
jgi:hypothetical protein